MRPVYRCGPPAAQQTISVTKYLKARGWNFMVRFIDARVGVEARINHDAIDQILDDRCNAVDTAEAFVEGCLWLLGGHTILLS